MADKQWCTCGKKGICMGCMIYKLIGEHLGIEGKKYLVSFIPTILLDKEAAEFAQHSNYNAMDVTKPDMGMQL